MPATTEEIASYCCYLRSRLTPEQIEQTQNLAAALPDWQKIGGYKDIGARFLTLSKQLEERYGSATLSTMNRLLVTTKACALPETIGQIPLTETIRALYPEALQRLWSSLKHDKEDYLYPNEYYLKDIKFVTGATVPCGAMVLDLRSNINWKYPPLFLRNSWNKCWSFGKLQNKTPFFRSHLEQRHLQEFNEEGMRQFYIRAAELLVLHSDAQGLISASWFYDPLLESISPHLKHLWEMPTKNGAFLMRGFTSEFDIASATSRSSTRMKLYEEGHYKPTCHLLVWPRDVLLRWYHTQK